MIKVLSVFIFLVISNFASSQYDLEISQIKLTNKLIKIKIVNLSESYAVFDNWECYFVSENKIEPRMYQVKNDTLQINLIGSGKIIETGHKMTDTVLIDGEKLSVIPVLEPNESFQFIIPLNNQMTSFHYIFIKLSPRDRLVGSVE